MSQVFKISEAASIAIHALILLGSNKDATFTTKVIAEKFQVSKDHCAKVMQRLSKVNLISSKRGPKGGFYLIKDANEITVLDIYEAIDGPLVTTSCFFKGAKPCRLPCCDLFGDLMHDVNKLTRDNFKKRTLMNLINKD
ncbi:MAG: Rrf2 family transcriptional regulator [Lentisphaeria bacterium]|nr:Rrf2 family transcriptional regulator [Lentisphaeria bacterium]